MGNKKDTIFRVRFSEKSNGPILDVLVRQVEPSNLPGLVCLRDFIFRDSTKMIIMPEEDAASKRFRQTQSLHIPYHNILSVEEIFDEPTNLHQLPFLREIPGAPEHPDH